jgi:CheY-like chemotaxis protein
MELKDRELSIKYHLNFKLFLELMSYKVREILLVSSPYDAFLIEEDVTLASRIINEYSDMNLSQPPRVTRTSSALHALELLEAGRFDLVITMPHLDDMDAFSLGKKIKERNPRLPVYLLAHSLSGLQTANEIITFEGIDKVFIWSGNADLLLAVIKSTEDRMNVDYDTEHGQVRVIIFVEDSPYYYSSMLPIFYGEVVRQIQAVLELGVNEEERLLIMRTRPKILFAQTYEEACELYDRYRPYLLGVISDTRFPRGGKLQGNAGIDLLSKARHETPYLPLLLLSNEPENSSRADKIPAHFIDKNSPDLLAEIHEFFLGELGFGDFIFRMPDGKEVGRATKLRELEEMLARIPDESLRLHIARKHLANWVMMRSEIELASTLREIRPDSFVTLDALRHYLITLIHLVRKWRQKGVVASFNRKEFAADLLDFAKIGHGSLGGKARGLAFMASVLGEDITLHQKYPPVSIRIPQTVVLGTNAFQTFVERNDLKHFATDEATDGEVTSAFLKGEMQGDVIKDLMAYLKQVHYPLSVRSSSLLEDAQFKPYAGLYQTYMIPNSHPELHVRLEQLIIAVKLVYASTYYESPKAFSKTIAGQPQEEAMAVIIQQLAGDVYGGHFYPAMSGVAQSHNFYPVEEMKPEEGVVQMALGFGKTVVEGEKSLRFSPKFPEVLPQFSKVEDMLENSQRFFYSLPMEKTREGVCLEDFPSLEKRDIYDARGEYPVTVLASTYDHEEHRIRDTSEGPGGKIVTFARVLKHKLFPLPELLADLLEISRKKMGCPVEMEFAVNLSQDNPVECEFFLLQLRPMVANENRYEVEISPRDRATAFCSSNTALGNGKRSDIRDIVFVKPEDFKIESTAEIADEVGRINGALMKEKLPYLLIGPGRWGSLDRFLGIPVQWRHISGVGAMLELRDSLLKADASQGSHFFQNITSLGIPYVTVTEGSSDFLDWNLLKSLQVVNETTFLKHVRLEEPMVIKINGRTSECVMFLPGEGDEDEDGGGPGPGI